MYTCSNHTQRRKNISHWYFDCKGSGLKPVLNIQHLNKLPHISWVTITGAGSCKCHIILSHLAGNKKNLSDCYHLAFPCFAIIVCGQLPQLKEQIPATLQEFSCHYLPLAPSHGLHGLMLLYLSFRGLTRINQNITRINTLVQFLLIMYYALLKLLQISITHPVLSTDISLSSANLMKSLTRLYYFKHNSVVRKVLLSYGGTTLNCSQTVFLVHLKGSRLVSQQLVKCIRYLLLSTAGFTLLLNHVLCTFQRSASIALKALHWINAIFFQVCME